MKRKIIFIFAVLCSLQLRAGAQSVETGNAAYAFVNDDNGRLQPVEPVYLDGVMTSPPWSGNWFVSFSGGASAFLGTPLGCNDLFGRLRPTYNVAVGKWFTPAIGARAAYQGMWLHDSQGAGQNYHAVHADLMWNLLGGKYGRQEQVRWSLSPFIGVGVLHNATLGCNPFAFSYGLQGEYNLSRRVSFVMELSGMTTFQNFDGYGKANRLGDNMLTLTAGFSFRFGKVGWKRVVDANPYIRQNDRLTDYANMLAASNRRYAARHEKDVRTLAELKKILEIEGLLDRYGRLFEEDGIDGKPFPHNDYSGLNSLRTRMRHRHWDGRSPLDETADTATVRQGSRSAIAAEDSDGRSDNQPADTTATLAVGTTLQQADSGSAASCDSEYLTLVSSGKTCIGPPIYFFFTLGTSRLTDASQRVNLNELARVAKRYALAVVVRGAADSATGTPDINETLGTARADFIVSELLKRGIPSEAIHAVSDGGIADYTPAEANRHTRVELRFPHYYREKE